MSKKIISFVQPNFQIGNSWWLPYSIGCLWAYANQFDSIKNCFELGEIIFRRDDIEYTAQKLASHDVVAFSTYVWNKNYNYKLAACIKELNPRCLILFGGPEPPIEKPYIFERYPFMDMVIKKEGELTFLAVLKNFGGSYDHIPGLLINQNVHVFDTGRGDRIEDLSALPSPYLTGVFDKIVQENPKVTWIPTLETNRGCPYQCTFCDWGSLTYSKVKKYSMEKIKAELEWFSTHSCQTLFIADANFGIFSERDNIIVDQMIKNVNKYGNPKNVDVNWAKNKNNEVVALACKLSDAGINCRFTISMQSLDDNVLTNIKRKNMDINKIEEMFQLCERLGVPVYTDLILGLPGETIDSWRNNFWRLFDAGNHTGIEIHHAQVLENAEMNLSQRSLFKIKTIYTTDSGVIHDRNDTIAEGFDVVVGTSTLPHDKMLDVLIFDWFITTTHITGMTTWIARFLKQYINLSYDEFYTGLQQFLNQNSWFAQEQSQIRHMYENYLKTGSIGYQEVGEGVVLSRHAISYITRIKLSADNKIEWFINLVKQYLCRFDLDAGLLQELIAFQTLSVLDFNRLHQYPLTHQFNHNILGYILGNEELHLPATFDFVYPENESRDLDKNEFLRQLFYGRKRAFAQAKVKKTYVQNSLWLT
jgi:tRNA A37 methylthiotransferase MiaB